ncbi:MAG: bifunctional 2-polyprenyl-6-hydroxyphenol methylase/3-demethylubiquinol 3-O-methyltransferase UbiG [Rickettsiaceae bacterium]|nr:bifunctional 2-polyprenyl-6-hydroxyphenol methylase/3-demethylubiquinol 3-O-methyltransferase UbiG [Rickettsiaceae bacterium]MDP4832370.1 bifunctional 2-polyprenyl-6-hydroxyphenol methylase/3-demethylubiquinol 3-O-methyltransferase UbiG [Rickettsiaceae bacterium]MDP5021358.1 bifunctional 2-polyprenyl-6-hydroxyphenol methylase/3-demethylubiquinol 3-O-methyltransferase UbiG [Rickettsiaceae bacterium]MDP5082864.1 bifunctional 2-polyprenyl-6-hydroxyphenol methylase/3-demethylubiquinol 3-O-methylt
MSDNTIKDNSSIDQGELNKFNKTHQEWWDLEGEFKPLHAINPLRIEYINLLINKHFSNTQNLNMIDIGCGGGLVCVPMHEHGLKVTGLDANEHNIKAANSYAKSNALDIEYIHSTVECYIKLGKTYDIVLCLEVIEHVANPEEFVQNISKLVAPGGILIFSTINRTKKAYLLAVFMAEYVLRWVPKKTHDYSKFIKPSEFVYMLKDSKLNLQELKGMSLSPITQNWYLSDDIDVNYFAVFSY